MLRKFSFYYSIQKFFFSSIFREYADEALKQGKVFQEAAREKLEEVAAETINSKFSRKKKNFRK